MSEQYAGLSLGVDVSQVDRAVKSLQQMKEASKGVGEGLGAFTNAEYVARQQAKGFAEEVAKQRAELQRIQSVIDPTASKMRTLSKASQDLDKLWSKGAIPDEQFFRMSEMLEAQTSKLQANRQALTEEGRAAQQEAKAKQQAQAAGAKFLADLEAQASALGRSSTELLQMKAAQLGVSAAAQPIIQQMQQQAAAMDAAAQAAREKAAADKAAAAAQAQAERSRKSFISQLEDEVNALGKTRAELLEMKAAQLGISQQAAPLIAQLHNQANGMKLAGISAGQYSQAIRMLPMQITDVVTSLASGMPVWMVAIQQGGQIKDSFGGIGNTFRALLGYLNPVTIALGAIGAALAVMGKSAYDAYSTQRDLNEALVLSGNYANITATQFRQMTQAISDSTGISVGSINQIATSMIKSGKYTSDQIKQITAVTATWAKVTGDSAETIISKFDGIAKDPVKALADLNEQYNFLEPGQLKYISNLEKTEGKTAAATAATKLFADTMQTRLKNLADSATPLEKMWDDVKKWSSDAWTTIGNGFLGAANLITDVVTNLVNQVRAIIAQGDVIIGEFVINTTKAMQSIPGMGNFGQAVIDQQTKIVNQQKENIKTLEKEIFDSNARIAKGEKGYIKQMEEQNVKPSTTAANKDAVRREAEELKKKNKEQKVTIDQGTRILDQYNADIIALQAQLRVLQQHQGVNDKISQQRKTLWNEQAKIQVLEEASRTRALTADEKSLLANKEKILALAEQKAQIGDAIQNQERMNKLQDQSVKFAIQMNASIKAMNETRAMGDRQAEQYAAKEKIRADYLAQGGGENDAQLQQMLAAQDEYYEAANEKRNDWLSGAKAAFENYGNAATDMYTNVGNIASAALNGMSDMMTEMLMTGKASFKDFASSIISMIIKMITQMVIFNSISGFMGGSGGFSFAGAGFATGGYTGDGGKYDPAGVVHKGEFVFTKEATSRIGARNLYKLMRGYANGGAVGASGYSRSSGGQAGAALSFGDINVDVNNGNDPKGLESGVRMIVTEMFNRACAQGGEIYKFVNSKVG